MTKPQFIRWANRREKAADALREALRHLAEMEKINDLPMVEARCERARTLIGWAIDDLATALERATESPTPPPQDEQGE